MELPFDYIIFSIIRIQKERKISAIINKNNLEKIINILINNLYFDDKIKSKLFDGFEFDFNYEIDEFMNNYIDYFYIDNDNFCLEDNVSLKKIDELIFSSSVDLDIFESEEILNELENNLEIMQLYGIKIRKDIYKYIINIYKRLDTLYNALGNNESNENIINKIRKLNIERQLIGFNIENSMDISECFDLSLYNEDKIINMKNYETIFNIQNNFFIESDLNSNPYWLSLCNVNNDNICMQYKFDTLFTKGSDVLYDPYLVEYKFYLNLYYLLDDEIKNTANFKLKEKLIKGKYRLMRTIDILFDNCLFMGKDFSSEKLNNITEDYDSMSYVAYFLIEELLSYDDKMYENDTNYDITYENTIKKLYIETYYILSKDSIVFDAIKENEFYGVNKKSSDILKKFFEKPKTRKKEI